jgi:Na+/H+ antiporter NhaC
MSNVNNDSICFVAHVGINTAVIAGVFALLTGSTVLCSVSFTGIIVGLVTGSIYILQKK